MVPVTPAWPPTHPQDLPQDLALLQQAEEPPGASISARSITWLLGGLQGLGQGHLGLTTGFCFMG